MPYTGAPPEGGYHGPSIRNPAVYEALMREGKGQASAAAISNAAVSKGHRKGRHRGRRGRGR